MHIAYSALPPAVSGCAPSQTDQPTTADNEFLLRYLAYQATCSKYHREIAAIQKFLPGWQPKFY